MRKTVKHEPVVLITDKIPFDTDIIIGNAEFDPKCQYLKNEKCQFYVDC